MVSYIYCATNLLNNKKYIGQSIDPLRRIREHYRNTRENSYFHKAVAKYGMDNFEWQILLHDVPVEDIDEAEVNAIHLWNTQFPSGYNILAGGVSCKVFPQEVRDRISAATKGKPKSAEHIRNMIRSKQNISIETRLKQRQAHLGKTNTPSARAKISAALTGHLTSQETRDKISKANKGRKLPLWQIELLRTINTGKKLSAESIEKTASKLRGVPRPKEVIDKISNANRGKKRTPEQIAYMRSRRKPITPETLEKMRVARLGIKHSPETLEKMRVTRSNKELSPETREKLRMAHLGKKLSPESIAKRTATRNVNRLRKQAEINGVTPCPLSVTI